MSRAYRCDKCGQFRDSNAYEVCWYPPPADGSDNWPEGGRIDLCPACASAVIEKLEKLAAHERGD